MSETSATLAKSARRVMPGGVNSGQRVVEGLENLVIAEAEGAWLRDVDGKRYCDFHAAFGPLVLGHRDPDVDAAVVRAQRTVDLVGIGRTRLEIELAELLVALIPSVESVVLTVTGSEATFHAIRLARAVTGRPLIVKFQGCYHGWHDAVAMNVISPVERLDTHDPLSAGMMPETVSSTIVLPFNDLAAVKATLADRGSDIAAVIVEPIPHNIGALLPRSGFLEGLRDACDRSGALLIFDEVITGFRHALGGYQSIIDVRPDLTTLGKAMANGYPIAALGGRKELLDEFSCVPGGRVFFAGTYNGHPACVAAALATIRKLREEPVHEHIFSLGEQARQGLREALADVPVPSVTTGFGSVWVTYFLEPPVETYDDLTRNDAALFTGYRRRILADECLEIPLNLKRSHASYAHSAEDIERLIDATRRAVLGILREGGHAT